MRGDDDGLRELRERAAAAEDLLARLEAQCQDGEPCVVAVTLSQGSYPTVAGRYYAMTVQEVTGTEAENQADTLTALAGQVIYAANLGTAIPPVGTAIPVDRVRQRWVFRYDG